MIHNDNIDDSLLHSIDDSPPSLIVIYGEHGDRTEEPRFRVGVGHVRIRIRVPAAAR